MAFMLTSEMYDALKSAGADEASAKQGNQAMLELNQQLVGIDTHGREVRAEVKTAFFASGCVLLVMAALMALLGGLFLKKSFNLMGA